jgi:cell division protein ZapA
MPEVTVEVAGRSYRLGCGEGEEQHLLALAARIDGEAARLGKSLGQMGEGRLLLMSALMLADRLSETEAALQAAERRATRAEQTVEAAAAPDPLGSDQAPELAASLDAIAQRIESLAGRIERGA